MLTARPRESEGVSWLLAGLWALVILATVPIALTLQRWVSNRLGEQTFGYITLLVVVVAAAATARFLADRRPSIASYAWLTLVALIYAGFTLHLWHDPAEALHLVQYGILGVLSYRALCHRVGDVSIYLIASMIGATVGMLDEFLQWMTPGRFWDLRDVWIDLLGVTLSQLAIAKGLRPEIISGPPRSASVKMFYRVGVLLLVALALTLKVLISRQP